MEALTLIAQTISATDIGIPTLTGEEIFTNILNLFYFLMGVIAIIVIIIAGIRYSTSAGDSARITSAKNQILFSAVGLVVIFSAFAITNFVVGRL